LNVSELVPAGLQIDGEGISFGATPIVPKVPRAILRNRSASSVGAAILKELFKLGRSERTVALENGN
jgi:hypothetical protein